ncbi:AEC family transporter [Arthrobacter sp.]|uniref:AEC family transporter n=1 Tax=Arthrobacter sp. TaxID=1667 RepID=UPI003A9518BB
MGFGIVLVLIIVGFGAAALLPGHAPAMQKGLTPAIYYITNPALMFVLLAETDLGAVVGVYTPIALLTAAVAGGCFALVGRFVLRRGARQTAVGAMGSSYVNAGNIGLPIALYAVGSSTPVVSVLLAQLLVIAPVYLAVFSWCGRGTAEPPGGHPGWAAGILRSFTNPVTVATAAGALVALTGWHPPAILWTPVEMLGHASIPLLLVLFGMGLHGQKPLTDRAVRPDVVLSLAVKLVFMPAVAWVIGHLVFGVTGTALFGVVVMAALPTAQNVYLFASQFRMPVTAARDVIFLSSMLSLPVIGVIALLLT